MFCVFLKTTACSTRQARCNFYRGNFVCAANRNYGGVAFLAVQSFPCIKLHA